MKRRSLYLAVSILLAASAIISLAQDKKSSRTLKVKLNYTGAGTVDDKHPIRVFLFDSPDFVRGGGMGPFASQSATAKDGTATFPDTGKSPVFVSAVFDRTGGYDGQSGPPPSGSSLGLYAKSPHEPAPVSIEAGSSANIEITFDDSFKMP